MRRGAAWIICCVRGRPDGLWSHPSYTAPGFPRVFYLQVPRLCGYFPLWALAAYRSLTRTLGDQPSLSAAGVVAALASEARALGPSMRAAASALERRALGDGSLLALSGIGCAAAAARSRAGRRRSHGAHDLGHGRRP